MAKKKLQDRERILSRLIKFAEELGWQVAIPVEVEEDELLGIVMGTDVYMGYMVADDDTYHTVLAKDTDQMN